MPKIIKVSLIIFLSRFIINLHAKYIHIVNILNKTGTEKVLESKIYFHRFILFS